MKPLRHLHTLPLSVMLFGVVACRTEEVGPNNVQIASDQPGTDQGAFLIAFASTAASDQAEQARFSTGWNPPQYHVLMDGQVLAQYEGTAGSPVAQLLPVVVEEGALAGGGYLDAGSHHFAIVPSSGPPIFEGDGDVQTGGLLRLFLFGPAGAEQGRFVFVPNDASPGTENITVINLMLGGQTMEVVSCTDATTCTPISPPLAIGDLFQIEVPLLPLGDNGFSSLTSDGAGIGYRLVPSASLPNPSVDGLYVGLAAAGRVDSPPAVFVAAPYFLSDQGQSVSGFN